MRILPFPVLILVLVMTLAAGARAADWDRGVSLYKKGDFQAALAEFQDIVRERPDAAGAWYYVGLCEFKLNRYKKVELPLSHAIDLLEVQSPASTDIEGAWYTIGFSYYLLGEYEKCLNPLQKYLELASRAHRDIDVNARRALGRAYYSMERFDDALPLLRASASGSEKEGAIDFYYIGAIKYKQGDDDGAIAALKSAVEAKPDEVGPLDLLADVLMHKATNTSRDAAPYWTAAAEVGEKLQPLRDDLKTATIIGRSYFGARQFEKAIPALEKIAKAKPDDGSSWLYYGIALSRAGSSRKAMEALEITVQLTPDSTPALMELAFVYESGKQYQQALRIYEKALEVKGSDETAIRQSIERVKALASQPQ